MADCDNDQECEKIVPTPIKPEPLPKQCSGGGESGEGTNDFNELDNRPKYDGRRMTGDTDIPAYSDFTGTDGQSDGTAGLVPAPTTADADKFLKSDGTWAEAGGGSDINVVQTTGTSQTDVMSQKATTDLLFYNNNKNMVQIGNNASSTGGIYFESVAIGRSAQATAQDATAIGSMQAKATAKAATAVGSQANANAQYGTAIGTSSDARYQGSVGLGAYSRPTVAGEVHIGSTNTSYGYNSSNYRLLTGLFDGQSAHDAVTVGQINALIDAFNTAAGTNIPHIGA